MYRIKFCTFSEEKQANSLLFLQEPCVYFYSNSRWKTDKNRRQELCRILLFKYSLAAMWPQNENQRSRLLYYKPDRVAAESGTGQLIDCGACWYSDGDRWQTIPLVFVISSAVFHCVQHMAKNIQIENTVTINKRITIFTWYLIISLQLF